MGIFGVVASLYSSTDETFDFELGRVVPRWSLSLPGAGCEWAKKTGGCTMCALSDAAKQFSRGYLLPTSIFLNLYNIAYRSAKKVSPEILAIYNGGSFLCDCEIPRAFQLEVCRRVAHDPTIRTLFVESRVEYVTPEKISEMIALLGGKTLLVGIGLEVADERTRLEVVRKGLTNINFERAVTIVKRNGGQVLAYVFIKPIGFSERLAIDEAVATAEYAFSVGVDIAAFEAALIHPNTEMANRYLAGEFQPPKLWTIIEVLQRSYCLGNIYMGNFDWGDDLPRPLAIPGSCSECSREIRRRLYEFRQANDISVLYGLTCECRNEWERDIK